MEKVDLAAPANKCDKCFNTVPPGALTCPECGAPVGNASTSDTEAEVYPELAKANLSRMRGDYKQAEDQLLSILKRFPNNPSANEMLGDLAAEREDFAHAVEWYEMALEIVPDSASIARKLVDARSKIASREDKDTTAQLGLPDPSSRVPILVGLAIILFVGAAAVGYLLGAKGSAPQTNLPTPITKIDAVKPENSGQTPEPPSTPIVSTTPGIAEDQALLQELKAKCADGGTIIGATTDPRSMALVLTFTLADKDDRALAARLARDAFAAVSSVSTVTLRGVKDGKVAYMADSTRAKIAETQTAEWKQVHGDAPDAWLAEALQNEWPVPATSPAIQPTTGGAATSGNTTPPTSETSGATSGGGQ